MVVDKQILTRDSSPANSPVKESEYIVKIEKDELLADCEENMPRNDPNRNEENSDCVLTEDKVNDETDTVPPFSRPTTSRKRVISATVLSVAESSINDVFRGSSPRKKIQSNNPDAEEELESDPTLSVEFFHIFPF